MTREIHISGERAVIPTGFYLHLVSCENKNDKLIKYLEDKITELKQDIEKFVPDSWCGQTDCYIEDEMRGSLSAYQDILERVKSGKYE